MLKHRILHLLGRLISRAILGPVHLYGAAVGRKVESPNVILVPSRLGSTDCWLFWARLRRAPIFIDGEQFSDCWGYRWLGGTNNDPYLPEGSLHERMQYWLDNNRCLVITLDISSQAAIDRISDQLRRLAAYRKSLTIQAVTFNYDFRLVLGSPVHWIWRETALNLAKEPLQIVQELQSLQKKAWSVKGYQTLSRFPLLQPSGRIPSALLLSWHEVRARRSWRWPSLAGWLWLPLAIISVILNVIPLLVARFSTRKGLAWPDYHQPYWLGPVYFCNHLFIFMILLYEINAWALLYLPVVLIGLHPLGRLADCLVDLEETADSRDMRNRIMNYFE